MALKALNLDTIPGITREQAASAFRAIARRPLAAEDKATIAEALGILTLPQPDQQGDPR